MEVHPQEGPLVRGLLGAPCRAHQGQPQEDLSRSHINLPTLQTLIMEIEAVLNERPLTYTPSDISDAEPLTPAHLSVIWQKDYPFAARELC